ncbi:MAG: ATP-binding protein [Bacteroidota bacterium]
MKEVLKEIILRNQQKDLKGLVAREVNVPFRSGKVISLIGPRRAGKTHVLYLLMQEAESKGIARERIVFINFEDERLADDGFKFDMILQAYQELYATKSLDGCYFFFDEIQNIEGWEKFIRRLYDDHSHHIFLTGSNASFLSTEIATSLRGRSLAIEVLPLSFTEYLRFTDQEITFYQPLKRHSLLESFRAYLEVGGFPELVGMERHLRIRVLQEYFNVMIHRDLIERFEISQANLLKYFLKKVFSSVSKPLSINKIYNEFRSNKHSVSKNTLYDFQAYATDAYVIRLLQKFDFSEIKRENSDKKAYSADWGLVAAVSYAATNDHGKLFENLVVMEFLKRQVEVFFYKKTYECDLIVKDTQFGLMPVQVAYELRDSDTRKREVKGLLEAAEFLNATKGLIISMDHEEEIKKDKVTIQVLPAYRYFTMTAEQKGHLFT